MRQPPSLASSSPASMGSTKQDCARQFGWEIAAINVHLHEIRDFLAKSFGVSGPQWAILTALSELDKGSGVSVKVVSKMLHVESSFVTSQSKLLEKNGFVRRKTSEDDARVVQMTLTDKSYKQMASLAIQQEELSDFIISQFSDRELIEFTDQLGTLRRRLEKARLKVEIGI